MSFGSGCRLALWCHQGCQTASIVQQRRSDCGPVVAAAWGNRRWVGRPEAGKHGREFRVYALSSINDSSPRVGRAPASPCSDGCRRSLLPAVRRRCSLRHPPTDWCLVSLGGRIRVTGLHHPSVRSASSFLAPRTARLAVLFWCNTLRGRMSRESPVWVPDVTTFSRHARTNNNWRPAILARRAKLALTASAVQ
jgi:hypothetical protein